MSKIECPTCGKVLNSLGYARHRTKHYDERMREATNPSIQCSACGQWKRLHGVDEKKQAVQRFHSCCEINGKEVEHTPPVCDECCKSGYCKTNKSKGEQT